MKLLEIKPFFDQATLTITYLVINKASLQAAVIDPVLNFDAKTGRLHAYSADRIIEHMDQHNLQLEWILETHAHADHMTASQYLKEKRGGQIGIGEHIKKVQQSFKNTFNFDEEVPCDGSQFDQLFEDGELINLGHLDIIVMHTPGHTPACVSYKIEDAIFVGDVLFMPEVGTARVDFPHGSARALYQSIQRILALPNSTQIYVGHFHKKVLSHTNNEETFSWASSVIQQKRKNIHLQQSQNEEGFIKFRTERDKHLAPPRLMLPAIQVNIRAGCLPEQENNGVSYLKLPLQVELN